MVTSRYNGKNKVFIKGIKMVTKERSQKRGRPKGTSKGDIIHYFEEDEVKRFFHVISKSKTKRRDDLIFSLSLFLGLRLGEVQKIKLNDLNMESFQIIVKGLKSGSTRSYDLPGRIVMKIKRWLKERKHIEHQSVNPFLFPSKLYHDQPINRNTLAWLFKRYASFSNISPELSFHSLRHTCALNLARSNWSGIKIKNWLRQKSISSTQKYLDLIQFKNDEKEAAGIFEQYL